MFLKRQQTDVITECLPRQSSTETHTETHAKVIELGEMCKSRAEDMRNYQQKKITKN